MNKETGIESKIIGKGFKKACLNLGPQCNLDCEFCHRLTGVQLMSRKSLKRGIDNLHSHGVEKITFTGGEPFLYKDRLFYSLAYAKSLGLKTVVVSNGTLISKEDLEKLEKLNLDLLTLSLDGSTSRVSKRTTRGEDAFFAVERIIRQIRNENLNINVKINTVVSGVNFHNLRDIGELVFSWIPVVRRWKILQFYPIKGSAKDNHEKFSINTADFYYAVDTALSALGVFTPGTFGYDFGEHISIAGIYDLEDTYLDIQANGAILLSANGETQVIGNILTDDLNDVIDRYGFRLDRNQLQTQWVLNTIK